MYAYLSTTGHFVGAVSEYPPVRGRPNLIMFPFADRAAGDSCAGHFLHEVSWPGDKRVM